MRISLNRGLKRLKKWLRKHDRKLVKKELAELSALLVSAKEDLDD